MTKVVIWVNFLYISNKKFSHPSTFCPRFFGLRMHKEDHFINEVLLVIKKSQWIFWLWGIPSPEEPPTDLQNGFRWKRSLMPNHLTFRFLIYFILQNCQKMLMLQHPVELGKIEKKKSWIRVIKSKMTWKKSSQTRYVSLKKLLHSCLCLKPRSKICRSH